jgi:hypothetical protein
MRFDNPSKKPFELVASRPATNGLSVGLVCDKDEGVYWVGYGLTVANLSNPPHGVRTFYDEEDARAELEDLSW